MAEARLARPLGWRVAVGGGTAEGAQRAIRTLIDAGVTGLVSFGLAGALDPSLRPGDLVVPRSVIGCGPDPRFTDHALARLLSCGDTVTGSLLASPVVVAEPASKQRLWDETGAVAVDLETGPVAELAAAHGLPFAALRAVCDPAWRRLPRAAYTCLDQEGGIDPRRLGLALLRAPQDLPALVVLAGDAVAGRRALRRRALALGAALAGA